MWQKSEGPIARAIPSIMRKTGNTQLPILGYEAMHALRDYLEARIEPRPFESTDEAGKRTSTMISGEILKKDCPLFIYTQTTTGKNKVMNTYGDRLNAGAVTFLFNELNRHSKEKYSAHGLRKYNWSALERYLPFTYCCLIQGRSIGNSAEDYTIDPDDYEDQIKLLEEYEKGYHEHIAVTEMQTVERVKEVEAENAYLRQRISAIEEMLDIDPELATNTDYKETQPWPSTNNSEAESSKKENKHR